MTAVRAALPLVPGAVEDCCARVVARTAVPSRDEARRWLTFLRALGLATETDAGFARTRENKDREALAGAFRERVFGAREVLDALAAAEEPLDEAAVFERVEAQVPAWERARHDDWQRRWRERVARLLAWADLLGLATRTAEGYRRVNDE